MSATEVAGEHPAIARRLGTGFYRAICTCGWAGEYRTGSWREARAAAEHDADQHAGREASPRVVNGNTPTRPIRIADELWSEVQEVARAAGVPASAVVRAALADYLEDAHEIARRERPAVDA